MKNEMIMDTKKSNVPKKESFLPITRIRIIMKSSPETENISQDSLFLVARSTEYFVRYLTHKAYEMNKKDKPKVLDYASLAEAVQTINSMVFLREIMPRKITFKEYKEIVEEKGKEESDEENSS